MPLVDQVNTPESQPTTEPAEGEPSPTVERTRQHPGRALVIHCGLAWLLVMVVEYHVLWLWTTLWVLALGVEAFVWLNAAVFSVALVVALVRRRAPVVPAVVVLSLALLSALTPWRSVYAQTTFWSHSVQFAVIAAVVDSGQLRSGGRYGAQLAGPLRGLSVTGDISHTEGQSGNRIRAFVPSYVGTPDGAVGFGYYPAGLGDEVRVDGYGDLIGRCFSVGDSWWWMESGCRS